MQAEVLLDITNLLNRLPDNEESNMNITPDTQVGVFPDTTDEINRLSNNDEESDTNENIDYTFEDWDAVEVFINTYAKRKGFVAIKSRKDLDVVDKNITRFRVFKCWKAGTNKPKKVDDVSLHREGSSNKTNCLWKAGFYLGKHTAVIRLTQFIDNHNYPCDPATIDLAPKNSRLPKMILDKIEHYTINGHLDAGRQYDLLTKEFPEHPIKKKNLYNAIQGFRGVRIHDESD